MNRTKLMHPNIGRTAVLVTLISLFALAKAHGSTAMSIPQDARQLPADISKAVVDSTMREHPSATELGKWGYTQALYLYGEYLVYERTHDLQYLAYIKSWADAHVDAQGKIDRQINALDYMLPGNIMLILYHETGEKKYKTAATEIWDRLTTSYPRTQDGGLWHATSRQHQLWLDGTYMALPFMVHYGEAFGKQKYAYDEASKQLLIYASHLNDPASGLLFHAYDESGQQKWADPTTHHSSIFWARSIGWYGMALIDVLEKMPADHPDRPKLIALVKQLVRSYAKYQDPKTGLWYNVVNRPKQPGNWLETSASSMYVYTISKAVARGYVSKRYEKVACKGYSGVLSQLSVNKEGEVDIANICIGTNVGDLQFYLDRPRKTNDEHGLGSFLIMNEQMRRAPCVTKLRAMEK